MKRSRTNAAPVPANIYLHYVLDLWIERVVSEESQGEVIFMRYADDLIVGFEYKRDADNYPQNLPARLAKFSLSLAEDAQQVACDGMNMPP